jgi:hypothetical protein
VDSPLTALLAFMRKNQSYLPALDFSTVELLDVLNRDVEAILQLGSLEEVVTAQKKLVAQAATLSKFATGVCQALNDLKRHSANAKRSAVREQSKSVAKLEKDVVEKSKKVAVEAAEKVKVDKEQTLMEIPPLFKIDALAFMQVERVSKVQEWKDKLGNGDAPLALQDNAEVKAFLGHGVGAEDSVPLWYHVQEGQGLSGDRHLQRPHDDETGEGGG